VPGYLLPFCTASVSQAACPGAFRILRAGDLARHPPRL
jgi:hypothetical protein